MSSCVAEAWCLEANIAGIAGGESAQPTGSANEIEAKRCIELDASCRSSLYRKTSKRCRCDEASTTGRKDDVNSWIRALNLHSGWQRGARDGWDEIETDKDNGRCRSC